MKSKLGVILCFLWVVLPAIAFAQQKKEATPARPGAALSSALEAKVRQAWQDYKNKKKEAFAAILTDDFTTVEEDGSGLRDKKSEVDEIDQFNIAKYTLSDFSVKPIGAEGALVTYKAEYSGTAGGQPVNDKVVTGEVWVKRGRDWKCLHVQMTRIQ